MPVRLRVVLTVQLLLPQRILRLATVRPRFPARTALRKVDSIHNNVGLVPPFWVRVVNLAVEGRRALVMRHVTKLVHLRLQDVKLGWVWNQRLATVRLEIVQWVAVHHKTSAMAVLRTRKPVLVHLLYLGI